MIAVTEQFVNTCCRLILSENKTITPSLISDIYNIVTSCNQDKIPLLFRKKFQLLNTLVNLKVNDPNVDKASLVDSVLTTGYFSEIESYINGISEIELTDDQVSKCIDSIGKRKSLMSIQNNSEVIEKFLTKLKTNDFTDVDDVTKQWQDIISNVHTDIIDKERNKNLHNITDLDLLKDDYQPVINQIKLSYSGVNSISTGYDSLDSNMYGGFAPGRLYMFCAPSGGGKSVMLINLVKNAVDRNLSRKDDKKAIYIYVSLENLIDESLVRIYSCLANKTTKSVIENYDKEQYLIPQTIKSWLNDNNADIKFIYRKPMYTNCLDILSYCNQIKAQDPNCNIRGIYIDYLDLMKPNTTSKSFDAYRLELGQVSIDMKTLAVLLRLPVVTCTQVNRAAYDPKNKMNLANVGESMKKVDNADWIAMLQPREEEDDKAGSRTFDNDIKIMDCKITKSRFGNKDISIPFRSNFKCFRFEEFRTTASLDIDTNLNELSERKKVADTVTQIQTGMYQDDDLSGFV